MKSFFLCALALCTAFCSPAADTLRVLFIGNSYTDVNNLPNVVSRLAAASGDSLYYQASVPGGYTFQQHAFYTPTVNLIAQGGWDYVVLQEQSQLPSFPEGQVEQDTYPYARRLDSLVHAYSPCAKTVFYMTWGRKNGDPDNCPTWPPVCTYNGMDSLLQLRYVAMAADNHAWLSPVGKVWHLLRNTQPALGLYQADESHPTTAGTYAAALSFYSLFFGKDPMLNTYNFGLSAADAGLIKTAAKTIVFDSLDHWRSADSLLTAAFSYTLSGTTLLCTNASADADQYSWTFGDNSTSSAAANPSHTYAMPGNYTVCLEAINECDTAKTCIQVQVGTVGIGATEQPSFRVSPNPFRDRLYIEGITGTVIYQLLNGAGQVLYSGKVSKNQPFIQFPDLARGIYFLRLQTATGQSSILKVAHQ